MTTRPDLTFTQGRESIFWECPQARCNQMAHSATPPSCEYHPSVQMVPIRLGADGAK